MSSLRRCVQDCMHLQESDSCEPPSSPRNERETRVLGDARERSDAHECTLRSALVEARGSCVAALPQTSTKVRGAQASAAHGRNRWHAPHSLPHSRTSTRRP